ncbi:hypothetical protein AVEN_133184-1 [Araneus ventricosus]|uniref:Uncharacterized protein n=1 Tax=Araneus ventricosus TaxID=182803 RepID=A0A4Y2HQD2_ARAVE|nr:hypothetical protein AVEN_133184-1 [Araneus ventricosus]
MQAASRRETNSMSLLLGFNTSILSNGPIKNPRLPKRMTTMAIPPDLHVQPIFLNIPYRTTPVHEGRHIPVHCHVASKDHMFAKSSLSNKSVSRVQKNRVIVSKQKMVWPKKRVS